MDLIIQHLTFLLKIIVKLGFKHFDVLRYIYDKNYYELDSESLPHNRYRIKKKIGVKVDRAWKNLKFMIDNVTQGLFKVPDINMLHKSISKNIEASRTLQMVQYFSNIGLIFSLFIYF